MPKMDDGPTDGPPCRELRTVSVQLTPAEAQELLEALMTRSEEDYSDPGYHLHISDDEGRELTIWVSGDAIIHNRVADASP
jgi:cobyrinic acid a,c-diamide synthase